MKKLIKDATLNIEFIDGQKITINVKLDEQSDSLNVRFVDDEKDVIKITTDKIDELKMFLKGMSDGMKYVK